MANIESRPLSLITNYIYFYHTNTFILLPLYPDSVTDTTSVNFSSTTPLSRSAPIYSYTSSGPRSLQINLNLHRDLMQSINYSNSSVNLELNDDYVDYMVKALQAMALPKYSSGVKMVNPPVVAIRLGNDIYCKGVVSGAVSTTYQLPILENNKYAQVSISFGINESDPYDAEQVMVAGSFRGLNTTLERSFWKGGTPPSGLVGER